MQAICQGDMAPVGNMSIQPMQALQKIRHSPCGQYVDEKMLKMAKNRYMMTPMQAIIQYS